MTEPPKVCVRCCCGEVVCIDHATGLEILYDFGNIFGGTQIASWAID